MLQIAESLCKIDNKYSLIFGNMTNRQNDEKAEAYMADNVLQNAVLDMKKAIGREVGILDEQGIVIASSDEELIGQLRRDVLLAAGDRELFTYSGDTYHVLDPAKKCGLYLFVRGEDADAPRYVSLALIAVENVRRFYDERYDKCNFVKNVALDNIMPGDIYAKARELHLAADVSRAVIILRLSRGSVTAAYETVSALFPEKNKDFVFNVSDTDLAVVKEVRPGVEAKDLENLADSLVDILENDRYTRVGAGIGTCVDSIRDIATSFKEAQTALEVGKVFYTEQNVVNYSRLGIARLIYHLPITLCETFLSEVFKRGSMDSLDQETLFTIQHFFENNLNVSETSRGLFVHRNTLVYRLEKIKKLTGLDLRNFEEAIVFEVALMVKKYLDANPTKY